MTLETNNLGAIQSYQKLDQLKTQDILQTNKSESELNSAQKAGQQSENILMTKSEMRVEQQASLVAHLFGDGSTTEQSAMRMTYQSAIAKLNEILMGQMPEYAQTQVEGSEGEQQSNLPGYAPISEEALQAQGGMEYWTPENTAKRIVDGATAFLSGFQNAHPELEGEALMNHFMDVVGGGLTQGFDEAKGILDELKVLEGTIAENIETTYDLVQAGMQGFQKDFLANLAPSAETEQVNQNS
jgi:hypothetical protein